MDRRYRSGILRLAVIAAGLGLANIASAALSINVGTLEIQPGQTKTFAITVTGGDPVEGLNFRVQLGDGGADNGGSLTAPAITNVDIIGLGTLFHASNTGQSNEFASGQLWAVSTTTDTRITAQIPADGTVAYLTIDATGTHLGDQFAVQLSGVAKGAFGGSGVDTDFAGTPATITNGILQVVPEPVSVLAASPVLGGLLLRSRQKQERRL